MSYYAEVPGVIFDIQRVGPSTGLPTRTAQGDITLAALNSHGDTKHVLLIPASVGECYEMAMEAFDLAERLQTLIFVMSDLDLGMNTWMSEPFSYPTGSIDRGKLLTPEVVQRMGGQFGRYLDVDGDGIPYRSIPGDGLPSYFARGSGHNAKGQYSERPDDYQNNLDRLARKFETAKTMVPKPDVDEQADAEIGIVAYGTSHWAVEESRDQLAREQGVKTSYLRLQAYPFTPELAEFISTLQPGLRRRTESRCADARADQNRPSGRSRGALPERVALQRPADRRAVDHGRRARAGRTAGA